ncbi:MAG: helix-turn-helix domain-containing protein [Woeseiaceae bacterium]|nr:helix-turn-helix domain-containing protein [Woeseiaceae bacterium]
MSNKEFAIGHLARETGCKVPTIRYYEQVGLLPEPRRSAGNQRLFGSEHVSRLAFIQHSRQLGFSQAQIRELLKLTDHQDQPCENATDIVRTQLDEVNRRIASLSALKLELERMAKSCAGDSRVGSCRILETLADISHEHCLTSEH